MPEISPSPISPYPYQVEAIKAIKTLLLESNDRGVVAIPTGAGKTIIFSILIRDLLQQWPSTRVCILAHRPELLTQAERKIKAVWKEAPTGILSAKLRRREKHAQILIASINTIYRHAYDIGPIDLIIPDECHLVPSEDESMYGQFMGDAWRVNPRVRIVGFTATPFRLDGGCIHGEGKMFEKLIYQANIAKLITDGYLTPLTTKPAESQINTSSVQVKRGDFVEKELSRCANLTVRESVREIAELAADRKSILVFACLVDHAKNLSAELTRAGIENRVVTGGTKQHERAHIIDEFDAGRLRCVVNVGCLTTGLDVTRIDCIACLRPTQSTSLWVQMVGRGSRLHPGKDDCLVLDFGGNTMRHGPIDALIIKEPGIPTGIAPTKPCPECGKPLPTAILTCPECGHQWAPREAQHDAQASSMPLLSTATWMAPIDAIHGRIHSKSGSPNSLRVDYRCGLMTYSEWVCFGHSGFPRQRAVKWWRDRFADSAAPNSAEEALSEINWVNLRSMSKEVVVRRNGKFNEIVRVKLNFEARMPTHDTTD